MARAYVDAKVVQQRCMMSDALYPAPNAGLSRRRGELAPDAEKAFHTFSSDVFKQGALSAQVKQIIAVAVAHVTQCPYCIRGHTKAALRAGASKAEVMEAIWVAAEMRAGATVAHALIAVDQMEAEEARAASKHEHHAGGASS